ncbi:hypothetical protein V2W45_519644 [Cenococcum geophilum]
MSATATPIPPARFAAALRDLPLSSLHAKAAELRNSIAHLLSSNEELKPFAEAGDKDCAEAIMENEEVIRRMEERISLLRIEVEGRGMKWAEEGEERETEGAVIGGSDRDDVMGDASRDINVRGEPSEQAALDRRRDYNQPIPGGQETEIREDEGVHL